MRGNLRGTGGLLRRPAGAAFPTLAAAACLAAFAALPCPAAWDDYAPRPSAGQMTRDTLVGRDSARTPAAAEEAAQNPPAPIPALPGELPRIVRREKLAGPVLSSVVPARENEFRIHVLDTDSGAVYALDAPVRTRDGGAAFLRLMPGGEARRDTLPLARIRSIRAPQRSGQDWLPVTAQILLPVAFGAGPFPFLAGLGFGAGATGRIPEWTESEPREFFDRRADWKAAFSVTAGLMPRSIFAPGDFRDEFVPTVQALVEAGPRRSALAYGLGLRIAAVRSPLGAEPAHAETGWWGFDPRAYDSAYARTPVAIALAPSVALTWIEAPGFALRTWTGGFLSLTGFPTEYDTGESVPAMGPEFGMQFDLRPAPRWALRMEGSLISTSDRRIDLRPSMGLGVSYSIRKPPAPTRQPGMMISAALALSPSHFLPGMQWEQDVDAFQSVGLSVAHSGRRETRMTSGDQTYYRSDRRSSTVSMAYAYGVHTDRSRRFHFGVQICAGVATERIREQSESAYPLADGNRQITREDYRTAGAELALGLIPEAGMRLGSGFGIRLRFHPLVLDPFAAAHYYRASLGLTYALPAGKKGN